MTQTTSRFCPSCGRKQDAERCAWDGVETITLGTAQSSSGIFATDDIVDHYRIGRHLGKGAMGRVYAATNTRTGHAVALKVLSQNGDGLEDADVMRFFREAAVTAGLQNGNIVRVYDFGQAPDGSPFLAMELIDGESLQSELRAIRARGERMSEAEATEIGIGVLRALGEIHAAGIVHRDLKPGNIMLAKVRGEDRVVKVVDFGIARPDNSALTSVGAQIGTVNYMSPEQAAARPLDARSDLFALGCILYECVAGQAR